jgi:glycosyltransferase involved in cell wall biosynthesis
MNMQDVLDKGLTQNTLTPPRENILQRLNNTQKLSIIIPAYNEEKTIGPILDKIRSVRLLQRTTKEIIVVDDCSTDHTGEAVSFFINQWPEMNIKYHRLPSNQGKGAAIHRGIRDATGEYVIVQDADLEYDPNDYNTLLRPLFSGHADVVYGSRFMGGNAHRILFFWHSIGNRLLTLLSNAFSNLNLSDMETGYKLFRAPIIKSLNLQEQRFGFEPEVTAKIARMPGIRIYEVGISYYGRTYKEGKKIKWKDGVRTVYCILKYGLLSRYNSHVAPDIATSNTPSKSPPKIAQTGQMQLL